MSNIYDLADIWNDGATTFTSIKVDVTDTASAAGSNLMDLKIGGVSKFRVDKLGNINFRGHNLLSDANAIVITSASGARALVSRNDFSIIPETSFLGFGNLLSFFSDTRLFRDAAGTLAQRNATNAQTFNIYNTRTDASNYERARMGWTANAYEIKPEAAGTGTVRVLHISGLPTSDPGTGILWNDAGTVKVGV